MSKVREYINETVTELVHNVTWPSWKELQASTMIVVVASIMIALIIFVMDYLFGIQSDSSAYWKGLLGFIYNLF